MWPNPSRVFSAKSTTFRWPKDAKVDADAIRRLKGYAKADPKGRARICLHQKDTDSVHIMFIVLNKGKYIAPHRSNQETMFVLEGTMDLFLFSDRGACKERIRLSAPSKGKTFLRTIKAGVWHTTVPLSDQVLMLEISEGPYSGKNSSIPAWAPKEGETEKIKKYLKILGAVRRS